MKNASRNSLLVAAAALTLAVAPSSRADMRIHLNLPLPPSPHEVLRHFPVPPLPRVVVNDRGYHGHRDDYGRRDGRRNYENRYRDDRYRNDGRWNHQNRYRDDRYSSYRLDRYRSGRYRRPDLRVWVGSRWLMSPFEGAVWVDGRWLAPPFPGAVWVDGYYDEYGDWIEGGWVRPW